MLQLWRDAEARGFGRTFLPLLCGDLRVPYGVARRSIKMAKIAASPVDYLKRVATAAQIARRSDYAGKVPGERGFALFEPGEIPGADDAVRSSRRLFEARYRSILDCLGRSVIVRLVPANVSRVGRDSSLLQSYIPNSVVPYELHEAPAIVDFALSRPVLEMATCYLGEVPILAALNLYVSLLNDHCAGSQLYHLDQEDFRQLKLVVAVHDIEPENGPLTLVDAAATARLKAQMGEAMRGRTGTKYFIPRFEDDVVERSTRASERFVFVGRAGSALALDTSRCLHFGSRVRRGYRVVLDISFMSRFSVLEPHAYYARLAGQDAPPARDRVATMVLGGLLG